jgi:hypothetical protein
MYDALETGVRDEVLIGHTGETKAETFHQPDSVREFHVPSSFGCFGKCYAKCVPNKKADRVTTNGCQTNTQKDIQEHDIMVVTNSLTKQNDYVRVVLYRHLD